MLTLTNTSFFFYDSRWVVRVVSGSYYPPLTHHAITLGGWVVTAG